MASPPLGFRRGRRMTVTVPLAAASDPVVVNDFIQVGVAGNATKIVADGPVYGIAMQSVTPGAADGDATLLVDTSQESIYEFACSVAPDAPLIGHTTDISGDQEVLGGVTATSSNNIQVHEIRVDTGTVLASIIRSTVPKPQA